jgi:hypothetical protein
LILFFPLSMMLWAESDLLDSGDSLDDLLGWDIVEEETDDSQVEEAQVDSVISDLIDSESLDIKFTTKLAVGYSPGFSDLSSGLSDYEDSPILEMTNTLVLDFTISKELRAYQKSSFSSTDFDYDLSSLFIDYNPIDAVSFRAGRFSETWGESKNFSHTNLIARITEDDDSFDTDILAFRTLIPWKTGFVEALALTREGFCEDWDYPSMEEFGWGLRINPPVPNTDLTFAFFAHPDLNARGTVSLKKTLFGSWEFYEEFLVALDKELFVDDFDLFSSDYETDDDLVDFSVNVGIYRDFFNGHLSLGGEYFYNGEEDELDLYSTSWDLYWGHNMVLYSKWKEDDWDLLAYARYSKSEESGIIASKLNWYFSDMAKFQGGGGWVWGDSAYATDDNPDDYERELFFYFQLVISGSWAKSL